MCAPRHLSSIQNIMPFLMFLLVKDLVWAHYISIYASTLCGRRNYVNMFIIIFLYHSVCTAENTLKPFFSLYPLVIILTDRERTSGIIQSRLIYGSTLYVVLCDVAYFSFIKNCAIFEDYYYIVIWKGCSFSNPQIIPSIKPILPNHQNLLINNYDWGMWCPLKYKI